MSESTSGPRRRVTAADIAREVGVSRATVGFVLNATPGQTISEGTRGRVFDAARRLGYRPHLAAQALARGRTKIVLLVLPDWPVEYSLRRYVDEASAFLDEAGYSLVTMTMREGSRARPLWETLQPDVVMGLLPFNEDTYRDIRAAGVDAVIPRPEDVAAGNEPTATSGPRLQVDHLVARGHRTLVYAGIADPRLEALRTTRSALAAQTAQAAGVEQIRHDIVDTDNITSLLQQWRAAGIDGVIAYNDDVAALVAGAALRFGLRIPDDLAIVGHDDSPIARVFVPSITSVHYDDSGLGRHFADLALSAANDVQMPSRPPTSDVTLIIRESA